MIIFSWIGNPETQPYLIDKARFGQLHAHGGKIVAGMKDQLVYTLLQFSALQQWLVAPAITIGERLPQQVPTFIVDAIQRYLYALRRNTLHGVQHMSRKLAHSCLRLLLQLIDTILTAGLFFY